MPQGTILKIKDHNNIICYWMIFYAEDIAASGYNKYIVLKMKHTVIINGKEFRCYLKGPQDSVISDTIKSSSTRGLYLEDFNKYILILPKTSEIRKDTYFTVGEDWEKIGYRVTGYDIHSISGIEFVTLDPVYIRDESSIPEKQPEDNEDDYFWINGGR